MKRFFYCGIVILVVFLCGNVFAADKTTVQSESGTKAIRLVLLPEWWLPAKLLGDMSRDSPISQRKNWGIRLRLSIPLKSLTPIIIC